jgi:hypothetical protein
LGDDLKVAAGHRWAVAKIGKAWFAFCPVCTWEAAPYYTRAEAERVAREHERHPNMPAVLPRVRHALGA